MMEQKDIPSEYITSITFNTGETIQIRRNDIVIFVGSNNVGKSQAIKDIDLILENPDASTGVVVQKLGKDFEHLDIISEWLLDKTKIQDHGSYYQYTSEDISFTINKQNIDYFAKNGNYKNYYACYLSTLDRLKKSDPPELINKNVCLGMQIVLSSMVTESGRGNTHFYGDFGRYTFQYNILSCWNKVDIHYLSNWVCNWIQQIYDEKNHNAYDEQYGRRGGRQYNSSERIGKKYQWLAFHKVLAVLAYNEVFYGKYTKIVNHYKGPWNPFVRDIDPSFLDCHIEKTPQVFHEIVPDWTNDGKFFSPNYSFFVEKDIIFPDKEWMLLADIYVSSLQIPPFGQANSQEQKRFAYDVKSFFVQHKDVSSFTHTIRLLGNRAYKSNRYQIFSREYYWSPCYKDLVTTNTSDAIPSSLEWHWETEQDATRIDHNPEMLKPASILVKKLHLHQNMDDFCFYDQNEQLILFYDEKQGERLYIRKDSLNAFLNQSGLILFYYFTGEKQFLTETNSAPSIPAINSLYKYSKGRMTKVFREIEVENNECK